MKRNKELLLKGWVREAIEPPPGHRLGREARHIPKLGQGL